MSTESFLSTMAVHYFGFTMALDYSIVLVSTQEMWFALGGKDTYFGFMFGIYAFSQALVSPLVGYISDWRGLKFTVMLSLVINVMGNVLYGLSVFSNSLYAMFFGRLTAGIGAGSVTLALIYLTNTTPEQTRGKSIASFKFARAAGFLGGPSVGIFLVPLFVSKEDNVAILSGKKIAMLFNVYTAPAWVAVANVVFVMLPLTKFCFKNPLAPHMAMKFAIGEAKKLISHTAFFMLLVFSGTACFWGVFSDLFVLAFGQYGLVSEQKELWKVYISGGVAFVVSGAIIRAVIHRRLSPAMFSILGLIFNVWGFVLLLDYRLKGERVMNLLYFGGVALSTSGAAWFFTGVGVYYSQKVTELSNEARNRRGVFLGCFNLADTLGRFAGPVLVSRFLHLANLGDKKCEYEKFDPSNCQVVSVNAVLAGLCGILCIDLLSFIYYHIAHGKRRIHGFLLNETYHPGQLPLTEDVYNLQGEGREWDQPDHTQMDSYLPRQIQRSSLHGSSSHTSSHDGSIHTI
ncbi:multidrug resistance protein 2-like [Montipora capricornis]|uniref:multidrug resistance protein 2-like n=1 Tax=Montipora capricornis TaxID=246305 RepID=UPI0035F16CA7